MLTKKGKYGLKAMIYLSYFEPGHLVPVSDIATAQSIPKKYLEAIFCELRNSGFVNSKVGKGGGYKLARLATEISVGAIIRAVDGSLAPLPCASSTRYRPCDDCDNENRCSIRLVMLDAKRALSDVLDKCTLAEMRSKADSDIDANACLI